MDVIIPPHLAPLPHGVRKHQTMEWLSHGCSFGLWILCAQNAFDHGRYHARPTPPWSCAIFQTPVSDTRLQFLMRAGC